MHPRIAIKEGHPRLHNDETRGQLSEITVEVIVPGFEVGAGTIKLHVTVEEEGMDVRGISKVQPIFTGQRQIAQAPFLIEPIYSNEHSSEQIGVRYRYRKLPGRWRARAQHITSEQIVLPPPQKNKGYDPVKISEDDSGWVTDMQDVVVHSNLTPSWGLPSLQP